LSEEILAFTDNDRAFSDKMAVRKADGETKQTTPEVIHVLNPENQRRKNKPYGN
jgi:hypothetical protein